MADLGLDPSFDASEFDEPGVIETSSNQAQASSPAPSATIQPSFDPNEFSQPGQVAPKGREGLSPDSAINKSPLSLSDRFAISTGEVGGNQTGGDKYLENKGFKVSRDKEGNRVVKDPSDGAWKYADEQDAWSLSAAAGDIADIAPDVIAAGAETAATGLATLVGLGGSATLSPAVGIPVAIASQAALSGLAAKARVSLGRSLGTYDADPEQETKDLLFESAMGALGGGASAALQAGARPTVNWLAKNLKGLGEKVSTMSGPSKEIAAQVMGAAIGVDSELAKTVIDNAPAVRQELKQFSVFKPSEAIEQDLKMQSIGLVKKVVEQGQNLKQAVYRQGLKEVSDAAENTGFEFSAKKSVSNIVKNLQDLVDVRVPRPDGDIMNLSIKDMTADQIADIDWRKASLGLKNVDDLAQTEEGSKFLVSKDARSSFEDFLSNQLRPLANKPTVKGRQAGVQAMTMVKDLKKSLRDVTTASYNSGANGVGDLFSKVGNTVDSQFRDNLDQLTGGTYSKYLRNYSEVADVFDPYIQAGKKAMNSNDSVYETLLNKLNSNGGANSFLKAALPNATEVANRISPEIGKELTSLATKMDIKAAAAKMSNFIRPGFKNGGGLVGAGVAGAAGAALGAVPAGAIAVGTSPRAWLAGLNASSAASSTIKQIASNPKAIQMLRLTNGAMKSIAPNSKFGKAVTANPALYTEILNDLVTSPFKAEQGKDELLQQAGVK